MCICPLGAGRGSHTAAPLASPRPLRAGQLRRGSLRGAGGGRGPSLRPRRRPLRPLRPLGQRQHRPAAEAEPARGGAAMAGRLRLRRGGREASPLRPAPPRCAAPVAAGDVSPHLSPALLACPAVKTGGVFFIPAHKVPKGNGALMPVFGHKQLSLIIVFLFSLPVPLESQQMSMP